MWAQLIWAGAVYLAGREVVSFLVDQRDEPAAQAPDGEPEPAEPESSGEGDASGDEARSDEAEPVAAVETEPAEPPAEQELREANRMFRYASGALVFAVGRHPASRVLSLTLVAIGVTPQAKRAWRESRESGRVTYSGLEIVQSAVELALGQFALTAAGWMLFAGGKRTLLQTRRKAEQELRLSVVTVDETAWVLRDGAEIEVAVQEITIGEQLMIRGGETIPVDGRIVEGALGVDQRALTGEAKIQELGVGDVVLAATTALSGSAVIEAERTGAETVMARVESLLQSTTSYEQLVSDRVTRVTERSVRPTLALTGFGLLTQGPPGVVSGLWTNAVDMAWVSAPYSMLNTIWAAARAGVLVKDARSLELISGVDTVVFDKTGTLTLETLAVARVHIAAALSRVEILRLAAAVERSQSHPIAEAIVEAAREYGPLPSVEGQRTEIGYGVRAVVDGREVTVGSGRLFANEGVEVSRSLLRARDEAGTRGHSFVFVGVDGRCVGAIELAPQLRPDARGLVEYLRERGLELMIVSGDDDGPTAAIARALGIERYTARALPEDKVSVITKLQEEGRKVCFVGDGINDALAMRRANVSVSLAGASSIAVESAQVVLKTGELFQLQNLFEIGDHFARDQALIMNSALTVTAVNAAGFLLAGFGLQAIVSLYAVGVGLNFFAAARPGFRRYQLSPVSEGAPERVATLALPAAGEATPA